jgi:hypothetical protein
MEGRRNNYFTELDDVFLTFMIPADNWELQSVSYYCKMSLHTVGVKCLSVKALGCKLCDKQQTALDNRSASVLWPAGREQTFPGNLVSFYRATWCLFHNTCLTVRVLGCKLCDKQQTALDSWSASVFWPAGRERTFPGNLVSFYRATWCLFHNTANFRTGFAVRKCRALRISIVRPFLATVSQNLSQCH